MNKLKYVALAALALTISLTAAGKEFPKREMRAAWIATVENIDWPSNQHLTTEEQKAEMIVLLDSVKAWNMNTVVFQIRPDADAFYPSPYEPWSEWLTGKQGQAPDPWYDPLQFAIDESRKRGLNIHVWLNPYRLLQNTAKADPSPDHLLNTHPEWSLTYGTRKYLDPGIPEVRDHVSKVVSDVVRRYDIDAIHFDDYFYPYKIAGLDFPDDKSFATYGGDFAGGLKDDWRRDNVNRIIRQLHDSIKSIKPWVEFGIAPFGVWRNKKDDPEGSETRATTNYDDLYADVLKWQREKWIDYVSPQLYWSIGKVVADYKVLVDWWAKHSYGCNVYTGQALHLLDPASKDPSWHTSGEIINQITLNRATPGIRGSIFFSAKYLKSNPLNIRENLLSTYYQYPALAPVNPMVKPILPAPPFNPVMEKDGNNLVLSWQKQQDNTMFVIYRFRKLQRKKIDHPDKIIAVTSWENLLVPGSIDYNPSRYVYLITTLSPTHTESDPVKFKKR